MNYFRNLNLTLLSLRKKILSILKNEKIPKYRVFGYTTQEFTRKENNYWFLFETVRDTLALKQYPM